MTWNETPFRRNDPLMAAVYAFAAGTRGPAGSGVTGVQHPSTRSNDVQALAFVVALFGLLLALAVTLGSPIA